MVLVLIDCYNSTNCYNCSNGFIFFWLIVKFMGPIPYPGLRIFKKKFVDYVSTSEVRKGVGVITP